MRKLGKLMTFICGTLTVVVIVGAIIMAAIGFVDLSNVKKNTRPPFVGQSTFIAQEGEKVTLWTNDSSIADPKAHCAITATDGTPVIPQGITTQSYDFNGETWYALGHYKVPQTGDYTVVCSDSATRMVTDPLSVGSIFMMTGGILGVFFGGGFLFLLTILGIVFWAVGNKKRRQQLRY